MKYLFLVLTLLAASSAFAETVQCRFDYKTIEADHAKKHGKLQGELKLSYEENGKSNWKLQVYIGNEDMKTPGGKRVYSGNRVEREKGSSTLTEVNEKYDMEDLISLVSETMTPSVKPTIFNSTAGSLQLGEIVEYHLKAKGEGSSSHSLDDFEFVVIQDQEKKVIESWLIQSGDGVPFEVPLAVKCQSSK